MGEDRLVGRRVLVMGASAGIGRVVGQRLCAAGAHVAFASRRKGVCAEAAEEAQGTAIGLSCDVTDESQCRQVVDDTVEQLGGLDDVVYSTGAISIIALATADTEWWRRTFETNVMGAALLTKFALPHVEPALGSMIYLSSVASIGPPWPGIGVYTATKAALNRMIETWRVEVPEVGFTRIFVGPTADAGTGTAMDMSALEHMARWAGLGVASGAMDTPGAIADAVELVLRSDSRIADVTVAPKDPPLPWAGVDSAAVGV
ncbi:MAG TPA: SDR family oxidoreductase [Acidimicrobiia bacterium]|nr:SDR family oxidoreductase [Acidimicrobiia bacterium]